MASRLLEVAILAAGQGRRMRSALPKVLHPVAGRPMVGYVLDAVQALRPDRIVVIVGYQADRVRSFLGEGVTYAHQEAQLGTAHALLAARDALGRGEADLLVVYGDVPLVRPATLASLLDRHRATGAAATVLTTVLDDPSGYGRVIRDPTTGRVLRIVEDADADADERAVREINTGIYVFAAPAIFGYLETLAPANRQGEFYLVDVVAPLLRDGRVVETLSAPDPGEAEGVNSRVQLARAEAAKRAEILAGLMASGTTVVDPPSTFVDWGVAVGPDTILEPGTILRGRTTVGAGCSIGPHSYVEDSVVGDGCRVWMSVVEGSRLEAGAAVGPFSHLRPGTIVGERARVGNYAELKNSRVGRGAKIQHHSYVGDAVVGPEANIGAGAVVVNYDGRAKHETSIGAGAFIGCNTNLVAPVAVGDGAYTAAGSTVTRNVPPGALAVSRLRQETIEGWVERRRPGTVSARAARA
ncbi:MAG: bifunctional UDP-N-acetylglucosamine diphosphorylase/glucosamine-1-phosphate N-acetyltransferase GlmU, partial [Bacillota bacterium]